MKKEKVVFVPFRNDVKIKGTVVNIFETRLFTALTVKIVKSRYIINYPTVYFYGKKGKEKIKDIKKYDYIDLYGKFDRKELKKDRGLQPVIVGFAAEKIAEEENENEVSFVGRIVKLENLGDGLEKIIIKNTVLKDNYCNIEVFDYKKSGLTDKFKVGDVVKIKADIQTKRRVDKDNEVHYYQDIVLEEIEKVN